MRRFLAAILLLSGATAYADDLAGYRAVYRAESVVDGRRAALGREIEIRRACAGWLTSLRETVRSVEHYTASMTESFDGLRLHYASRVAARHDEGDARLEAPGGAGYAEFTRPERRRIDLPAGTLFPAAHMRAVLDHLRNGTHRFDLHLFDGQSRIIEIEALSSLPPETVENAPGLSALPSWRIRVMFPSPGQANPGQDSIVPQVIERRIWSNGVMIDERYGMGPGWELLAVEILPDEGC